MKALVYTGVQTLELREEADPERGEDALVRIAHSGICGSDLHALDGHDERRPPPMILGHEAAGTVIAGPMQGKRVTINPLVSCQTCEACLAGRENRCPDRQIISLAPRPGALAELVAMPPRNLIEIPDDVPTEKAALTEPLACGWHAVGLARRALDRPLEDARCLAIGGGAIGLGAALCLLAQGAREVHLAEPHAERRAAAARAGDLRVYDPTAQDGPREMDVVIDGVGYAATRAAACAAARPGGAIVHIGLGSASGGVDVRKLTLQEIAFLGAYTYTAEEFRETAQALFDGRLGALDWPEIRPLSDGPAAFADIAAGRAAAPKIILTP